MDRYITLFPLLLLLISSCGSETANDRFGDQQSGYEDQMGDPNMQGQADFNSITNGNAASPQGDGDQVTMHPITDPKTGMVSQRIPLPSSWRIEKTVQPNGPAITGPGGVKVYYRPGGSYTYSNDPYMQQTYQMAGMSMRSPIDISTYIQQDLSPAMGKMGMRLVKQFPLPQVAAKNESYSAQLFKAAPSREQHSSMGSDWVNAKGEPLFVVVNMMVSRGQNDVFWNANIQMLEAEPANMERAKTALINSIVNTQYNPQQIAAYNAAEQQKTNQSWSQHNAKMQQNQSNFDRQQAMHRNTVDAVNNSMMSTYNSQNASGDHMQRDFINTMRGEETVNNPADGQQYQVESGANQYWMNNNNEYIPSNNTMFDPNADPNLWNQQWQEVTPE
jgi:hypothetical protein